MGAYVNLKNRASQNRAQNRADETHLTLPAVNQTAEFLAISRVL